ncbi:MAG: bifunctional folylpolyglutamate synthase/dihydrofolate synthase [Chloroflexi bacterium]|nr:bifunctional folylpolyglutamate synthase/dihydrofolate synthase [Chloroflexota bacterium]
MVDAGEGSPYRAAIEWLHSFADFERKPTGHRFSLDRPRQLLRLIGDPQRAFRSVAIAGTKGKGSTAAMLQALLQAAGHAVALYTQPHLHTYRERVRVGQALVGEAELADGVERLQASVEALHRHWPELGRLTTYELGTALALRYFAERQVDWAVLEVGLGGRLDAVNVVDSAVAVLTPISLDHTQVLGSTIEQIAGEKAGIIHPGGTVVSAPQPPQARAAIERACRERGARLHLVDPTSIRRLRLRRFGPASSLDELRSGPWVEFDLAPALEGLQLPLGGAYQALNAATALAAAEQCGVDLSAEQARQALASVRWPGRLEALAAQPTVIADGAHNGASAEHLARAVREHFPWARPRLVLGTSADKDLAAILAPLAPLASQVIATQAQHPRARPAEDIAQAAKEMGAPSSVAESVAEAIDLAVHAATPEDLVLVTGSLFVVAEAREHLGWAAPGV